LFSKLKKIFQALSKKERLFFLAFAAIFLVSLIAILIIFFNHHTIASPIEGGEFTEGIVDQPIFINPVLASSDTDRDLVELLFEDVLDLSQNYKWENEGKTIRIRLKDDLHWSDGQPLTSDDVIFTLETIQNQDTRSPLFSSFKGVTPLRVSERELTLTLPLPYAFFENILKDLKPIPKHIFADVPPANLMKLSNYNLEPIGSGPFKYLSYKKQKDGFILSYQLVQNKYAVKKPYLKNFNVNFYQSEEASRDAFNKGEVDGLGNINSTTLKEITVPHQEFALWLPRYYAIFLNQNTTEPLKDKNVRTALNYATDRKKIINEALDNQAMEVFGPLTPTMEGYDESLNEKNFFSLEKAGEILEENGWQMTESGIRAKTNKKTKQTQTLEFNLIIPENPIFSRTANILRDDWQKIGVKINIQTLASLEETIKNRDYQMILFGNIFGRNPDLFSFWHSSEKFYPGLNLSLYENKTVDALIEKTRQNFDENSRINDYKNIQNIINDDRPAIFLFSRNYLYLLNNKLKGFEEKNIPVPSARFENVDKWYVKTIKVFK
jgi:peptide/nickel transport system substrate-binding protein